MMTQPAPLSRCVACGARFANCCPDERAAQAMINLEAADARDAVILRLCDMSRRMMPAHPLRHIALASFGMDRAEITAAFPDYLSLITEH